MNTSKMASLLLGGVCMAMLAGCYESEAAGTQANADPGAGKTPREVCTEQVVTRSKEPKDKNRVVGTVAGALVGGVVGNEVGGKGTSQDIATVAGAAAGGYAGNRVQKGLQDGQTEQTVERTCRTVYE
ncbi:MAG TPA: glycine zipper 2TM domain-containing protein [Steroidobacteraceae bacterium]|nr:glycine zipper 2TM domain-containing protein [Steroidobacteraceae bacterium]